MSAKSEKSNNFSGEPQNFSLTRESLAKLRLKARRSGVWFSDLKQFERGLLDLTISKVKRVRSFLLAKVVSQLVSKLTNALETSIVRLIRTEGPKLAMKISQIANDWGHRTADVWVFDRGFMQFLVVNNFSIFKS